MTSKTFCDVCEKPTRKSSYYLASSLGGLRFEVEVHWPYVFNERGAHPDVCESCVRKALSKKLRLVARDEERRYRKLVKRGKERQRMAVAEERSERE